MLVGKSLFAWVRVLTLVSAFALLTACAAGGGAEPPTLGAQDAAQEQDGEGEEEAMDWRHGMIVAKGDVGFTSLFAQEKGFFEKHGLRVDISQFEGSSQLTQAILAGEVDTAENNADPVLKALAQGGDVTAIGSTIAGVAYNIYASLDLDSLADLEGKTLGVSKPGAFPDLVSRAMMIQEGLDPESVTLVNAGNDVTRYQALVAGRIDATAASAEFVPQAESDGVHAIAEAAEILPDWPRFIVWANPETLAANSEGASRFLAAMIESLQYALDNEEEVLAFAADVLDLEPDDTRLSFTYDTQAPLVDPMAEVPVDKLQFVADFLKEAGEIESELDIGAIVDVSYQQRALELVEEGGR